MKDTQAVLENEVSSGACCSRAASGCGLIDEDSITKLKNQDLNEWAGKLPSLFLY